MVESPYRIAPGKKLSLEKLPTDDRGEFAEKEDAKQATKKDLKKMADLQTLLYASASRALLVVLQAMDAGGKDGSIEHVFSSVNPQGCMVTSFKAPSHLEMSHDYLWRYHAACPARGMIGIFNRSQYESVLVERVKGLVPEKVWSRRYDQINAFENMLVDEGTVILKFHLHISKEEQKKRMEARLSDRTKNWKFNSGDLVDRKLWDDYQAAYEEAISRCSTDYAPWYVVPSDHKWYRNWVLTNIISQAIEQLGLKYPQAEKGLDKIKIK